MFSHIMVGADDIPAAKTFYDAALGALGLPEGVNMGDRVMYRTDEGVFMVTRPLDGKPACFANGGTIGFNAPSASAVDAFHDAGIAAGGADEGAPGHSGQLCRLSARSHRQQDRCLVHEGRVRRTANVQSQHDRLERSRPGQDLL